MIKNDFHGCIVCNGEVRNIPEAEKVVRGASLVIAADGGARHLVAMKISPDLIIGDMDSIDPISRQRFADVETIIFPRDKDQTDTELAVDLAMERGCRLIDMVGALGGRVDHELGNISLLLKYPGRLFIRDGNTRLFAIERGLKNHLRLPIGSLFSLIPFPRAGGVTVQGVRFPLENEDLEAGTRGISNTVCSENGWIHVENGCLLLYTEDKGGSR